MFSIEKEHVVNELPHSNGRSKMSVLNILLYLTHVKHIILTPTTSSIL